MTPMRTLCCLFLIANLTPPLIAQTTRILLPVTAQAPLPGANGSVWVTEIVARNNGLQTASFFFPEPCALTLCLEPYESIPAGTTMPIVTNSPRGAIVLMNTEQAAGMVFSIRVRDLSRQSETWGTEIPVVPQTAAFTSTAHFLNIPSTNDFRVTLRIYDFTDADSRQFNVKVFSLMGNTPLFETTSTTTKVPGQGIAEAELSNFITSVLSGRLRFEVSPLSGEPFWAFVSVTNNATQHVTIVSEP
jgi:hypothetical protein